MKFKIVCKAIFTEKMIKDRDWYLERKCKKYMQRTYHYKANTKQEALDKLLTYQEIYDGKVCEGLWTWKVVSVEATK